MRIEHFEYRTQDSGWRLEPTEFFPDLTLLVGVSGVGKTQILKAIQRVKRIARDKSYRHTWGDSWRMTFCIEGRRYTWECEYEARAESEDGACIGENLEDHADELIPRSLDQDFRSKITREQLIEEDVAVIDRDSDGIRFEGKSTPKLSPYEPAVALLNQEDRIRPVFEGIGRIVFLDQTVAQAGQMVFRLGDACRRYSSIDKVRSGDLTTYLKLAIVHEIDPAVFRKIVRRFRQVFTQVEDVKVTRKTWQAFADVPFLEIKEKGSEAWIPENRISSGMFRTLMHLSSVMLWPASSVILIDEFENSLGVNCLDEIAKDVLLESRRLQFILTSHHPYVINNIDSKHWKIVTRKGAVVTTRDAKELGIGRSRHEAFLQLINSDAYSEGITVQ